MRETFYLFIIALALIAGAVVLTFATNPNASIIEAFTHAFGVTIGALAMAARGIRSGPE